jgi:hypothetical protein
MKIFIILSATNLVKYHFSKFTNVMVYCVLFKRHIHHLYIYIYFSISHTFSFYLVISALNNLLQPQTNGRYQQLYQNRNGQNFNGLYNQNLPNNVMHGLHAFSQFAHSHASSNQASQHNHASGGGNSAKANGLSNKWNCTNWNFIS